MIPDATVVDAGKQIIDVGVVGAGLVFCMLALAWVTRQWVAAMKKHDELQEARLKDVKDFAAIGEAIRQAMAANTVAIESALKVIRERE